MTAKPQSSIHNPQSAFRLVILLGPSGVGKTTLRQRLLRDARFAKSVSATTRTPRAGEMGGVAYHFLTPEEFERRVAAGEFLEHAVVHGKRYGTLRRTIESIAASGRIALLDIDVQGADQVQATGYPAFCIFVLPPSDAELVRRLQARGSETPESIRVRLETARRELARKDDFDACIINDDVERAGREILALVFGPGDARGRT